MEIDHIFIMCDAGAPEAAALARLGIQEGPPNTHPGQGTANRRFYFHNFYLELLWVRDPVEVQSEVVRRTRLWERWSGRRAGACPFGVVLRPGDGPGDDLAAARPPFPTWSYAPPYMPEGIVLDVARDTPLAEPGFFHLGLPRARRQEPVTHGIPAKMLTRANVGLPAPGPRSEAARAIEAIGLLSFDSSPEHVLRLTFDHAMAGGAADLRPDLPLVLEW